ncbi:hypothetical protein D9M72_646790 [compost metagenome]
MTDEHHRDALLFEAFDDLEQAVHFCRRKGRRRFVQDQDLRFGDQGPGDLDELLLGDAQGADGHCHGTFESELRQDLLSLGFHSRVIQQARP